MKRISFFNIYVAYIIGSVCLLFYSYTQVDLGLTLTKVGILQSIQKAFQYIGYFRRPLSAEIYTFLIVYFFVLYSWILYQAKRSSITRHNAWVLIWTLVLILVFSYPAFSYDLFNYMFTAKTVLLYHRNPYATVPLLLSGVDPWLGFLHWTHAVSAYPPLWIVITFFPYLLGFGYFLLILYNFKILIAFFLVLAAFYLERSLQLQDKKNSVYGLLLFMLNPLVLFEVLVSGHNDIVLIAFGFIAYYLYLIKKTYTSFFALAVSIAFKSSTIFWLPLYLMKWKRSFLLLFTLLSLLAVSYVTLRTGRDIQPWYFLILISVTSLMPENVPLQIIIAGLTFGLLSQYIPFLYFGNWNNPVSVIKFWATVLPVCISILVAAYWFIKHRQLPTITS